MSNNQNKNSNWEMLRDDVTKWTRKIELGFEKNTLTHIVVKVVALVFGILAAIVDTKSFFGDVWSPRLSDFFLILLIVVLLVVDFGHVLIAKRRALELRRTISLVQNMENIIREASGLNSPSYRIAEWFSEHDIMENGDVRFKKVMRIEYVNEPVSWIRVPIGVIDGDTEDKTDDLKIEITNPEDGGKLPYAVIEESERSKTLAIMLEPLVTLNRQCSMRMRLTWRGAYLPLISKHMQSIGFRKRERAALLILRNLAPLVFFLP